jgi:hypothetical protein
MSFGEMSTFFGEMSTLLHKNRFFAGVFGEMSICEMSTFFLVKCLFGEMSICRKSMIQSQIFIYGNSTDQNLTFKKKS